MTLFKMAVAIGTGTVYIRNKSLLGARLPCTLETKVCWVHGYRASNRRFLGCTGTVYATESFLLMYTATVHGTIATPLMCTVPVHTTDIRCLRYTVRTELRHFNANEKKIN